VLFKPEDREQGYPERELAHVRAEGHYTDQKWLLRKDGSHFLAQWVTHLVRNEQGEVRGFAKVLRDETQRMRAERERVRLHQLERDLLSERVQSADAALDRTRQELRDLAGSLMSAQEDERRRIARELHDDFSQRLAALEMGLEHVRQRATRAGQDWASRLDTLVRDVAELSKEVRSLSHRLHPSVLDDLGLDAAIRQLINDLQRTAGLTVRLTSNLGGSVALPNTVATALYRIAQEALRNIVRHARDASVMVNLAATSDEVRLTIHDDGPGMDLLAVREKGGLGLVSMRERANLAGGSLEIRSAPGAGTEVMAVVPCWWAGQP
jgi:two-component system CheB/CheR fusion protein